MSVNPSETSSNDYNKEILQKVIREGKINKSSLLPEVVDYIKKTLNEHPEWEHQSLHVEHIVKILKEEQDVSSQKIATLAHHHLEKAILSSTNPVDFIETESTHPLTIEALGMLLTHAKIGTLPEMVIYSLTLRKRSNISAEPKPRGRARVSGLIFLNIRSLKRVRPRELSLQPKCRSVCVR
ncbi:MAG: hypothetical protein WCG42_04945 [Parachlamydiaceae bacterium]